MKTDRPVTQAANSSREFGHHLLFHTNLSRTKKECGDLGKPSTMNTQGSIPSVYAFTLDVSRKVKRESFANYRVTSRDDKAYET